MPGLAPGIHVFLATSKETWMAGTSPAMTAVDFLRRQYRAVDSLPFCRSTSASLAFDSGMVVTGIGAIFFRSNQIEQFPWVSRKFAYIAALDRDPP